MNDSHAGLDHSRRAGNSYDDFRDPIERHGWGVAFTRLVATAAALGLWQVCAGGPHSFLPADAVSKPSQVAPALWRLIVSGQIFPSFWTTFYQVLLAVLIAAPLGVMLAMMTSRSIGRWALEPIVTAAFAVPKVGLVSLYILLFGVKISAHLALVVGALLFVFYFNTRQAIDELDRNQVAALRLMGASHYALFTKYIFRSMTPHLLTALRIALPLAFAVELFAELRIPTTKGLGVLLDNFIAYDDAAGAMAVLLFVVLVAYALDIFSAKGLRSYTASVGIGLER